MDTLVKNRDYSLHHADAISGFGLLYSAKHDECVLINPVATTIWRTPTEFVDPVCYGRLFEEVMGTGDTCNYIEGVILDLRRKGLLLIEGRGSPFSQDTQELQQMKQEKDYKLSQIYFYVTEECNARCYHCWQPTINVVNKAKLPRKNQVSAQVFLSLVENALTLGLQRVKFTGGEPLLRADLPEIIEGVRQIGPTAAIETNGFLIDESIAEFFTKQKVEISLSLDAGTAKIHDRLRGHKGAFERVTTALRMLSKKGNNPRVIMSVSKWNFDQVEAVLGAVAENGGRHLKVNLVSKFGGARGLSDKVLLTLRQVKHLYEVREELESKFGVFLYIDGPPAFASLLDFATGHVAICPFTNILSVLPDGSISFCGIGNSCSEMVFGRTDDNNLDIVHLWRNNDYLKKIRQLLKGKTEGICGQCVLESLCKGSCRALAHASYNSYTSPHPWCQMAYEEGLFPNHYLRT